MKRTILGTIAAVWMLCAGSSLSAASHDGRFAVEEAGRPTCSFYLQARNAKSPRYGILIAFVEGYLTAANRYEADTFDLTPWHTTAALSIIIDDYCTHHPSDELAVVAQKLTIAFKDQRLKEFSPMVEIRNGKAATAIYKTTLEQIQAALTRRGLYSGPATGEDSPQLRTALVAFQTSKHLAPSGIPDAATAWNLLVP